MDSLLIPYDSAAGTVTLAVRPLSPGITLGPVATNPPATTALAFPDVVLTALPVAFELTARLSSDVPSARYLIELIFRQGNREMFIERLTGTTDHLKEAHICLHVQFTAERPDLRFDMGRLDEDRVTVRGVPSGGEQVYAEALPEMQRAPPPPEQVDGEFAVWYGTNRKPNDAADANAGFSAERDSRVHYGLCHVFVPKSHTIGSIGSGFWRRLLVGDDRLKLLRTESLDDETYWRAIARTLSRVAEADRHAVVFLHGYNVSFHDAAVRAAQIGFDLSIKGAMAFFSWPSKGSAEGYPADEATIQDAEFDIEQFLVDFAVKSGARAIHIIAHSMGNRALLAVVERLAARAEIRSCIPFEQVILAAPDVDAGVFARRCVHYRSIAKRTTLYISEKDKAVGLSKWLHQYPRVGYAPPVFVASGIDTVNVKNVDLSFLGHSYLAEARDVLVDMHALITRGVAPSDRFGMKAAVAPGGGTYWLIGA